MRNYIFIYFLLKLIRQRGVVAILVRCGVSLRCTKGGFQHMSVHPCILPCCLRKLVGKFQPFDVVLWNDAPHRLHGWTLICWNPLSYDCGIGMGFLLRAGAKSELSNHQSSIVLTQDSDKGYRHA
jgi:hypothetical protein